MSEEVLLYAARVSGLMAWILGFGALAAGLLARSAPDRYTNAGLWAADTRNLLGRASILAIVIHAASIAAAERFDLTVGAIFFGRGSDGWLAAGLTIGTICAWAAIFVELARLAARRLNTSTELLTLTVAAAIVAGGAYHGWQVGSDTRNPLAVTIIVVCAVLLIGAASIGFTTFMAPSLGDTQTGPGVATDGTDSTAGAPGDLFQSRRGLRTDDAQNRSGKANSTSPLDVGLKLSLSRQLEPPERPTVRGPEIPSARDVAVPQGVNEDSPAADDQGAWTMRRLPDAPKPQHRKRPRR